LGRSLVEPEDLLFGLLCATSSRAVQVLTELRIDCHAVRARILEKIGPEPRDSVASVSLIRDRRNHWPIATERRLFGDGGPRLALRIAFGGIVGAIAGAMVLGIHGSEAGAAIGCTVGAFSWFAPIAVLGSIAGALIGKEVVEGDFGILAGAILGTAAAALAFDLMTNLYGYHASLKKPPASGKA
jgi:hypothetical protein